MAAGVRQRAGAGDRRPCRRPVGAQRGVGGDRRDVHHPLADGDRQRCLQVHRRGTQLESHGTRLDRPRGAHGDPPHQPRRRVRMRAGPRVRPGAGSRCVSHHRRWEDVDAGAVRGREHRLRRPGDGPRRPQRSVRGDVAAGDQDLESEERRAGERPVGDARRRHDVEAAGGARAARGEPRGGQDRRRGRPVRSQSRVHADRRHRPLAVPLRRRRRHLAPREPQPRYGGTRAVLRALRRVAGRSGPAVLRHGALQRVPGRRRIARPLGLRRRGRQPRHLGRSTERRPLPDRARRRGEHDAEPRQELHARGAADRADVPRVHRYQGAVQPVRQPPGRRLLPHAEHRSERRHLRRPVAGDRRL